MRKLLATMDSYKLEVSIHRNRRNGRGHGVLCAIQHLGVVGKPGGSGRGECVRSAINNRTPHRRLHSRHRRAQRARQNNRLYIYRHTACIS